MSKKLPTNLAIGFWNAGFLATIGGTAGRLVGNIAVTLCGIGVEMS